MRVKVWIETDKVGSRCEEVIEVDDDASDDTVEEHARETAYQFVSWSYERLTQPRFRKVLT